MNGAKYMFGTAFALLSALPIVAETIFLSKSVHSPQAYPSETTRAAAFVDSAMISITGEHAVWDFSGMSAGVEHVVKAGQKNDTLFAVFAGRGLTDFLLIGDTVKKSAYVDRSKRLAYRVAETEMVFHSSIATVSGAISFRKAISASRAICGFPDMLPSKPMQAAR